MAQLMTIAIANPYSQSVTDLNVLFITVVGDWLAQMQIAHDHANAKLKETILRTIITITAMAKGIRSLKEAVPTPSDSSTLSPKASPFKEPLAPPSSPPPPRALPPPLWSQVVRKKKASKPTPTPPTKQASNDLATTTPPQARRFRIIVQQDGTTTLPTHMVIRDSLNRALNFAAIHTISTCGQNLILTTAENTRVASLIVRLSPHLHLFLGALSLCLDNNLVDVIIHGIPTDSNMDQLYRKLITYHFGAIMHSVPSWLTLLDSRQLKKASSVVITLEGSWKGFV